MQRDINARHLSAVLGAFVQPDPVNAGADLANPRSWNAYAYVGGDPLGITDPSGVTSCTPGNHFCGLGHPYIPPGKKRWAWSFKSSRDLSL